MRCCDAYINFGRQHIEASGDSIFFLPSESLVQSRLPDDPKTWTFMLLPGHRLFRIRSSLDMNFALLRSLSADGNIRSYSSLRSPVNLVSSVGLRNFFGMVLALSSKSPPIEYGILRLEKAMPVSYRQPVKEGALARDRVPFSMVECADLGEPLRKRLLVEGDRASKDSLLFC